MTEQPPVASAYAISPMTCEGSGWVAVGEAGYALDAGGA